MLRNTRKLVLRLSKQAREWLGMPVEPGQRRESIAHAYWKHWWARNLRDQGYEVQVEAPWKGGYVDVLGRREGETVAVEVETGESDVVGNVRNCLRSGFGKVIVVATDERVRSRIETKLAKAGLGGMVTVHAIERWRNGQVVVSEALCPGRSLISEQGGSHEAKA